MAGAVSRKTTFLYDGGMKSDANTSKPPWRNLVILLLWAAAIALIFAQSHALRAAAAEYRAYARGAPGIPRVPADWWRASGVFVPLGLIGTALWMQRGWRSALLRRLSRIGLVILVPIAFVAGLLALARGPAMLGSVRLPSGARFILALEPIPTDAVYTLYRPIGRWGFWWREVARLDYSEDGRFTGDEKIVLSPDSKWLLIARAGVWTDCFSLVDGNPIGCGGSIQPDWSNPSYEADMHARSTEIQRLTGLRPPRST